MKTKIVDFKLLLIAIISAIIMSFAIVNFTIPASLYPSGVSGISRLSSDLLLDYFNLNISYSIIYFSLNIIATIFVFKTIGKKFAIYSIIQFSLVAFLTTFLKQFIYIEDLILQSIFGGILNGVGVGLALAYNFSTGGFDFLSVYFANKYKKDVWNCIFIANSIILLTSAFFYGWERALYSIIFQYSSTSIIKLLHQRYTFKTLTIITNSPDEVSNAVLNSIRHGITEINVTGYYSHDNKTMLYTVVNSFQYKEVVKIVMEVDPKAFINVQNTNAVYGNYYQKPLD